MMIVNCYKQLKSEDVQIKYRDLMKRISETLGIYFIYLLFILVSDY